MARPERVGDFIRARRQLNPTLLLHFEQQGSRRHVFELPLGRAPVPEPGQFTTEPITAPAAVLAEQSLDLRQAVPGRTVGLEAWSVIASPTSLAEESDQSPAQNETICQTQSKVSPNYHPASPHYPRNRELRPL